MAMGQETHGVVPVDLERGDGGAIVVACPPCPADPGIPEPQPVICLRAAPFIFAVITSIAMVIARMFVDSTYVSNQIFVCGLALLGAAITVGFVMLGAGGCDVNPPRMEND